MYHLFAENYYFDAFYFKMMKERKNEIVPINSKYDN